VIVLWGVPGDGPLDAVRGQLVRLGVDYRLLDQRDAARSTVRSRVEGDQLLVEIDVPRERDVIDFERVAAVYLRPVETERALPPEFGEDKVARQRAEDLDRAIVTWCDLTTAVVINPPAAMAVNNSKPYQLQIIAGYGFDVPPTLVTTDPRAVREFAAQHDRLIYKSVSGVRSIVNVLSADGLERLDEVANVPTQFQAYVPGYDVRVHVIGESVFATEVRSDAHDYRYASLSDEPVELSPVDLPEEVGRRCRAMATGMGLAVAGIDLRRTQGGAWVCFEVNPSPAFVYYEEVTGQPMGEAIASLLAQADRVRANT
jgi:hypothetical protein